MIPGVNIISRKSSIASINETEGSGGGGGTVSASAGETFWAIKSI